MTERFYYHTVSRKIAAPAAEIFDFLADPTRHLEIDGSGFLRDSTGNSIISGIGDKFFIRMHNPQMKYYDMVNDVVEYERDRRLAWEPLITAVTFPEDEDAVGVSLGQRWTYELEPIDSTTTLVIETYCIDGDVMPEWLRLQLRNGEYWGDAMVKTLDNLEQQFTGAQE